MTELTELLRAQAIGWSDRSVWPIEKLEASRKMFEAADVIDTVLMIHTPVIRYTSGSTDPRHVPSRETWCAGCGEIYPCRTVAACRNIRQEDGS